MVLDSMSGSVIFSAIDLTDGFYQILMRESDIPLTAVSTPFGMLWEWLVMPQGLKNAPATLNRMIPMLSCYVSKKGVRADPEKVSSICSWPSPTSATDLRQWLVLADYLHKYTKDYAGLIQPLSSLLTKDTMWSWRPEHQAGFDSMKKSLASTPILMLPDDSKPYHVVCDASDFAIGKFLPLAEFALNNAQHTSTGLTPFFANNARHPRVPALLAVGHPTVSGASTLGGDGDGANDGYVVTSGVHDPETLFVVTRSKAKHALATPGPAASPLLAWTARTLIDPGNTGTQVAANYAPKILARQVDNAAVSAFVQRRASIAHFVRDALQDAVDKQKENTDNRGRKNIAMFRIGEQVLLSTDGIRSSAVTNLGASKLAPRFIGPFRVVKVNGEAYTLDIPTSLRLHPTFYVGRLKKYDPAAIQSTLDPTAAAPEHRANAPPGVPPAPPTAAAASPSAVLPGLRDLHSRLLNFRLSFQSTIRRSLHIPLEHSGETWEPRSSLLRDVPDAVLEYENEIANENAAVAEPRSDRDRERPRADEDAPRE
ncbi:Putative Polyprotein [Phytophthora palmivora]|uniref:Polyprotein n=1 Tax=Phytophthora palmivora TaxID=4796 RepID=A0A2P4XFX4_9STRA|nr:Putative Polyprotein [Phytophthora palmivora]